MTRLVRETLFHSGQPLLTRYMDSPVVGTGLSSDAPISLLQEDVISRYRTLAYGLMILACSCGGDSGPVTPPPLELALVEVGYDFPVFVTAPPGDEHRLMVVERGGRIILRKDGVRQDSAFLNLTSLTGQGQDYGILGMAFHPSYGTNRRFFVFYIDNNANPRVDEFNANPEFDTASPAVVATILSEQADTNAVHFGGTLAFGPDGYLYIGTGDGGTGGSRTSPAQDSTSLLGKMLRVDVDAGSPYAVPPDNPFAGRPGWRGEIYMLGLRNPYRWSFDRANGDLYIGDVGEDSFEEINYIARGEQPGANLGWPIMEGTGCYRPATGCDMTGLRLPVVEYSHSEGCSVTGGYVHRGDRIPGLPGTYFYGDFCGGWVRSFIISGGSAMEQMEYPGFPQGDNVVGFGEDASGEIYVVMASGIVYRITGQPTA